MKRMIVNFACPGRENYLAGQDRLSLALVKRSIKNVHVHFHRGFYPVDCPTHLESPYAFKWYMMREAFVEYGADQVMWLDASVVPLKSMKPLWDKITEKGILLFNNPGCMEATFTSKDCLEKIGCPLEEAKSITQVCGGVVGIDSHNETAMGVLNKMISYSLDGVSFQGGDGTGACPEFVGHRHDQSCLSYLAFHFNLPREPFKWVAYSNSVTEDTILELRGM